MTDLRSRIIAFACVLVGVWIITYWIYQPTRARKISLDELPKPQPRVLQPEPRVQSPTPQPNPRPDPQAQTPSIHDPVAPPKPVRTRKVQKLVEPQFRDYMVQKGDTSFERIAARKEVFGDATKAGLLARANPMFSPDRLKAGISVLRVPLDPDNIQGKLVWVDEPIPDDPTPAPTPTPTPAPPPAPAMKAYTIQSGDTLWTIAEKMYGKGALWHTIADANKDVLPDPDRPKLGTVLKIPPAPQR